MSPCLLVLAASAIFFAPNASAAVQFGNSCTGSSAAPGAYTLVTLETTDATLPIAAPNGGVITKMTLKFKEEALPFTVPMMAKVLRASGSEYGFTVVGEQKFGMSGQSTSFEARIPVLAGDRLGLSGEPFTYMGTDIPGFAFFCQPMPGGILGASPGNVGLNQTAEFKPATEGAVPLVATIEPDADGDGYGDETQDKCPQSAVTHDPCPVVTLDALSQLTKGSVTVVVAVSAVAPVTVQGTVKLGKGKTAKLAAPVATVNPGTFGRFKLTFPKALKKRLKELPPSKKLTLKVTASATNVAGAVSTDALNAKLKGQQKPQPRVGGR